MLHFETFTFLPQAFAENTYVLWDDTQRCVIVDPGCYTSAEQTQLLTFLEVKGLTLEQIWLTHAHLDHVFGLNFLQQKFQVPVVAHEKEKFNLERGPEHAMLFGFTVEPFVMPDIWVDEGDTVKVGETVLDVLFAPGHSPGHIAFLHRKSAQLFSGDVIFRGSFGRTDLPGGSMEVLRDTILNKILTLPPETKIYAGHMGPTTVDRERKVNPMVVGF